MVMYDMSACLYSAKSCISGLVLVSTGVWKLKKPSVAGHYVKSSDLNINADNRELAYAA